MPNTTPKPRRRRRAANPEGGDAAPTNRRRKRLESDITDELENNLDYVYQYLPLKDQTLVNMGVAVFAALVKRVIDEIPAQEGLDLLLVAIKTLNGKE